MKSLAIFIKVVAMDQKVKVIHSHLPSELEAEHFQRPEFHHFPLIHYPYSYQFLAAKEVQGKNTSSDETSFDSVLPGSSTFSF